MTPRLLTVAFLAAACPVAAAPIPEAAKEQPLYFPTTVGAKWVYERAGVEQEPVRVVSVEKSGKEVVVSRAGADGTAWRYAKVFVSPAGLRESRLTPTGKSEVVWVLKLPLKAGESWAVGEMKRTVHGPEAVDVPAGRFQAVKVVDEHDSGAQLVAWYAPGVGRVKQASVSPKGKETVTLLLKSFTPGRP
ncbi:TapB family protein [Urbifossiella limnaea]|uniref:DUF3108 domain-containing protein n=1 Tax=Urbifossiella limnaea TaxID=2528023 RepID=A0A517XSU8_9BACT|nr:hypothetical protein [Urbifossiella limnaea]QDU20564.1 hypothetical protein ETAA1_25190 [Urbifossiella limnaea]